VVPVRVRVPSGTGVDPVYLRVLRDAEPAFIRPVSDGVLASAVCRSAFRLPAGCYASTEPIPCL